MIKGRLYRGIDLRDGTDSLFLVTNRDNMISSSVYSDNHPWLGNTFAGHTFAYTPDVIDCKSLNSSTIIRELNVDD